jgi:hypothetical protein
VVASLEALDELLAKATPADCTGAAPEVEEAAARVRLSLQLAATRVDGLSALVRAARGGTSTG